MSKSTMEDSKKEAVKNVARSMENFAIDFHKNVANKEQGNFVSSALSAHVVLSMAAYGAKGATAEQMRKSLHLPDKDTEVYLEFRDFIGSFKGVQKAILKLANKIYTNNKLPVKDEFLKITEAYFYSRSETMDVSKPDETAKTINQWCVDQTNGKIQNILTAGDVTKDLVLVLLNAAYFKGNWKNKFNENYTRMKPFNVNETTTIEVPTMHITNKYFYKTIDELNAQCIKLSYENEDLEMEIIVPKDVNGLALIEKNLENLYTNREKNRYVKREIVLALPKFKIETTIDLKPHLEKMGMGDIFTDKANFKGISDSPLKVSKVLQKAFIEVNEQGSEAAAVSAVQILKICSVASTTEPVVLNIDRPFLYNIIFKKTVIFSGRITNP